MDISDGSPTGQMPKSRGQFRLLSVPFCSSSESAAELTSVFPSIIPLWFFRCVHTLAASWKDLSTHRESLCDLKDV